MAAFSPELLPAQLRPWVLDIAERMQCPADFIGVTAIVAAGAIVGRKVGIRPQERTDWTEVANLWGCIVGRPGVMKSPSMKQALAPLYRLNAAASQENADAAREHEAAKVRHALSQKARKSAASTKARKAALDGEDIDLGDLDLSGSPDAPTLKRFIVTDTSYEKLGEVLQDNPNGVLVFRDELVSLLKPLDREENAAARGFYLSAWNGTDSYTFDRIIRGTVHIEACCLSVIGGTQPARLSAYLRSAVRGGEGDDGLAQRFGLLVWPDVERSFREVDRFPDAGGRTSASTTFDRLAALQPSEVGAERDAYDPIPFLRFDPDAQTEFRTWRAQLETRVRSGTLHPAMESHLAKYRGLAPKLALLLHLLADGKGPVSADALIRALAWIEYLETHAARAYSSVTMSEVIGARTIIAKLRSGDLELTFTARDVQQAGWSGLGDPDAVRGALDLLTDLDWLMQGEKIRTGGRPKVLYTANPLGLRRA